MSEVKRIDFASGSSITFAASEGGEPLRGREGFVIVDAPRECDACGAHLDSVWFTADTDPCTSFCSPDCLKKHRQDEPRIRVWRDDKPEEYLDEEAKAGAR